MHIATFEHANGDGGIWTVATDGIKIDAQGCTLTFLELGGSRCVSLRFDRCPQELTDDEVRRRLDALSLDE